MKVVINSGWGGFELTDEQFELYLALKGIEYTKVATQFGWSDYFEPDGTTYLKVNIWDIDRSDPALVQVVEQTRLSGEDNPWNEGLKIIEIPDGISWTIEDNDGNEWVAETHRTWS